MTFTKVDNTREFHILGDGMRLMCYRYHAWESLAMKYLEKLTPKSIREGENSFNIMVRP